MNSKPKGLSVEELLNVKDLRLEVIAGSEGLSRMIIHEGVQKPGLALAGHYTCFHPEHIQVMGATEMSFLDSLPAGEAQKRVAKLVAQEIPCLVVTCNLEISEDIKRTCIDRAVPLLGTPLKSAEFFKKLKPFLVRLLNPSSSIHGVLVDVYGVGILLFGKSGIGKSEVALELVQRGHRLVADDIVEIQRTSPDTLIGSGPEIIKHHMEIRGLGILNIMNLFGSAAVRDTKRIDMVVELVEWNENEEYDRTGTEEHSFSLLGIEIPLIRLPVRPGRNITAIIEVAARNQLLKVRGFFSSIEFQKRLMRALNKKDTNSFEIVNVEDE